MIRYLKKGKTQEELTLSNHQVKKIVEEHGGEVLISNAKIGANIEVRLPLARAEENFKILKICHTCSGAVE